MRFYVEVEVPDDYLWVDAEVMAEAMGKGQGFLVVDYMGSAFPVRTEAVHHIHDIIPTPPVSTKEPAKDI